MNEPYVNPPYRIVCAVLIFAVAALVVLLLVVVVDGEAQREKGKSQAIQIQGQLDKLTQELQRVQTARDQLEAERQELLEWKSAAIPLLARSAQFLDLCSRYLRPAPRVYSVPRRPKP